MFYWVLMGFLPGVTGFNWVLLGFTEFYWAVLGLLVFTWFLPSFTGF